MGGFFLFALKSIHFIQKFAGKVHIRKKPDFKLTLL